MASDVRRCVGAYCIATESRGAKGENCEMGTGTSGNSYPPGPSTMYSRTPPNPYPSVDAPGYGLWEVMGYERSILVRPKSMGYGIREVWVKRGSTVVPICAHMARRVAFRMSAFRLLHHTASLPVLGRWFHTPQASKSKGIYLPNKPLADSSWSIYAGVYQ